MDCCSAQGKVEVEPERSSRHRSTHQTIKSYSRGDWWVVIYTACKSLAKWWGMFLGTSHFDLEGWQKNPPVGFFRERIPPWNYK